MSARERIPTNTIRASKITKGSIATPTGVTYEGGDRQIFVKPGSATPDNVTAYRVTVTNSNVSPVTTNRYVIDKGVATASAGKGVGVPVPVNGVNYGMKVAEIGFDGVAGADSAEQAVLALKLDPPVLGAAEARNGSVTLNWSAPTGLPSGFAVTSYKIVYESEAVIVHIHERRRNICSRRTGCCHGCEIVCYTCVLKNIAVDITGSRTGT